MDIQEEPIQLQTTKILKTLFGAVMQQHGCLVEETSVTLPVGSARTLREQYLETTRWYDIVLPDQFRILEAYDLHRGLSMLFMRPEYQRTEKRNK